MVNDLEKKDKELHHLVLVKPRIKADQERDRYRFEKKKREL